MAFTLPQDKKIRVWLIGDSTMSKKDTRAYPEAGWGMPFSYFFDSGVVVDNRAKKWKKHQNLYCGGFVETRAGGNV